MRSIMRDLEEYLTIIEPDPAKRLRHRRPHDRLCVQLDLAAIGQRNQALPADWGVITHRSQRGLRNRALQAILDCPDTDHQRERGGGECWLPILGDAPDRRNVVGPHAKRTYAIGLVRSEEHTSELQSLMRISYAVFCCKKKKT